MSQHTPEPWDLYVDAPTVDPEWHVLTNESRQRVIANVHIERGNRTDEANGHLLKHAPNLLSAAEQALSALSDYPVAARKGYVQHAIASLVDAIHKAKGITQ